MLALGCGCAGVAHPDCAAARYAPRTQQHATRANPGAEWTLYNDCVLLVGSVFVNSSTIQVLGVFESYARA